MILSDKKSAVGIATIAFCFTLTLGSPALSEKSVKSAFLAEADINSDGMLSADEFIMFQGEREMEQRDRNKDGKLSKTEWIGQNPPEGFYSVSFEKFNEDGDDIMSVNEIIEVFTWAFKNRDKDKNGFLSASEAPKSVMAKK